MGRENFYGFGSVERYVEFFARRGFSLVHVADVLGITFARLVNWLPNDFDVWRYPIYGERDRSRMSNDEVKALFEHYAEEGPEWEGWRGLLEREYTPRTLIVRASRLGLSYRKHDRKGQQ